MKKNSKDSGIRVRGGLLTGKVVSAKSKKTVIVERDATKYISKYKRYAKGRSKIAAHNPENMNAKKGDIVRIGETRKLSKTKSWIVIKILERGEEA
ncbi:30S ribosomal protein S17 [Candidatus Micrarchaeota archaeon]|nr:30S ribosomal protein S17 [Candidatus Micrarchaeota archaeon]